MGRRTVVLDCSALSEPDAGQLDGIARLCLRLKRRGWTLRLVDPSPALVELIELAGLASVLGVEAGGEAEEREDPGGVQEERQLGDEAP
jgi:anti-anti-sigma regulatory factor